MLIKNHSLVHNKESGLYSEFSYGYMAQSPAPLLLGKSGDGEIEYFKMPFIHWGGGGYPYLMPVASIGYGTSSSTLK